MSFKNYVTFSFLFALLFNVGCKIDPCEDIECNNGIALQDAYDCFCLCDRGWFGDNCDVEDACETQSIDCYNGGTCLNGECLCDLGFEGDTCEIVIKDYYLGNYNADLNCPPNSQNINFSIVDSSSEEATVLYLVNIANQSLIAEGRIDENGNVVIPNQSNQTTSISGTITRNIEGFIIEYELTNSGGSSFCEIEIQK
jgi:hypothetical protein